MSLLLRVSIPRTYLTPSQITLLATVLSSLKTLQELQQLFGNQCLFVGINSRWWGRITHVRWAEVERWSSQCHPASPTKTQKDRLFWGSSSWANSKTLHCYADLRDKRWCAALHSTRPYTKGTLSLSCWSSKFMPSESEDVGMEMERFWNKKSSVNMCGTPINEMRLGVP